MAQPPSAVMVSDFFTAWADFKKFMERSLGPRASPLLACMGKEALACGFRLLAFGV